jgi:hypothetical protein
MRSIKLLPASALMAALLLAGAALAQAPDQKQGLPRDLVRPAPDRVISDSVISVEDIVERIMSFDKNKDGKITKDELPERMQFLIELGDAGKGGALDRDQVRKLVTARAGSAPGGPEDSAPAGPWSAQVLVLVLVLALARARADVLVSSRGSWTI